MHSFSHSSLSGNTSPIYNTPWIPPTTSEEERKQIRARLRRKFTAWTPPNLRTTHDREERLEQQKTNDANKQKTSTEDHLKASDSCLRHRSENTDTSNTFDCRSFLFVYVLLRTSKRPQLAQTLSDCQNSSVDSGEAAMVSKKRTLIAIVSSICDNLRSLFGIGWSSKNFLTWIYMSGTGQSMFGEAADTGKRKRDQ